MTNEGSESRRDGAEKLSLEPKRSSARGKRMHCAVNEKAARCTEQRPLSAYTFWV